MARSYARVASDVNMAEEAEMRAMEGGSDFFGTPLTQAATHGTSSQGGAPSESPFPPARQPASGAESRRGDGEQQPGDQQSLIQSSSQARQARQAQEKALGAHQAAAAAAAAQILQSGGCMQKMHHRNLHYILGLPQAYRCRS